MSVRRDDITLTFDIPNPEEIRRLTPEKKLALIQERMLRALTVRVQRCKAQAAGLQIDMEVVNERLMADGHLANIESVKVAGYHISQTELRVLVKAYNMVRGIIGGEDIVVDDPDEESDED